MVACGDDAVLVVPAFHLGDEVGALGELLDLVLAEVFVAHVDEAADGLDGGVLCDGDGEDFGGFSAGGVGGVLDAFVEALVAGFECFGGCVHGRVAAGLLCCRGVDWGTEEDSRCACCAGLVWWFGGLDRVGA